MVVRVEGGEGGGEMRDALTVIKRYILVLLRIGGWGIALTVIISIFQSKTGS